MNILPNQIIDLTIKSLSGVSNYRTRVEDCNDNQLLIAAPIKKGQVVPVRVGTQVTVSFISEDMKNQGRFTATGLVERRVSDNIPTLLIKITSQWERTQERSFVRVDCLLKAVYSIIEDGVTKEKDIRKQNSTIRDLSGGGCLMVTPDKLAMDSIVRLTIYMDSETLTVDGVIARILPQDDLYGYGISFQDIDEKDRQTIIQFAYRRQLELRRRGV